ncbi:hypothetical protein SDC9_191483 [bioreactor metagenome]|uniref:Uncharacterized protein n=1 Tax=bioreactor metagenome TaxID=1076179 RepID=A0A645HZK9_9ZZZZ
MYMQFNKFNKTLWQVIWKIKKSLIFSMVIISHVHSLLLVRYVIIHMLQDVLKIYYGYQY